MRSTPLPFLASLLLAASACGSATPDDGSGGSGAGSSSTTGGGAGPSCTADAPDHTGDGTYYAATGAGACSFDPTSDLMVAAMNHVDFAGSAVCGACVHIAGPSGEVKVRIVDLCPECPQGDIDLSQEAFAKIAEPALGRVTIHWQYVPCDVSGPVRYHFKEGSNQWWSAVQIRDARNAVAKLEVKKDSGYVAVNRVEYNYFVDEAGMGPGPYTFRITDVGGHVLEDTGVPFVEAGDSSGAAQFPACE